MNIQTTSPLPASPALSAERRYRDVGYLFAAAGAVLFSTKAVIVKLAYGVRLDPETLLALRMGFALPFYLGIGALALRDRRRRDLAMPPTRHWVRAVLIGLLGYWFS